MEIKVRAQQVTIETPKEGAEPWIRIIVQKIERDGEIINMLDRYDSFSKRLSDVATEMIPFQCDMDGMMSVYEISVAIHTIVVKWLVERYNGTVDAEGNVIIG